MSREEKSLSSLTIQNSLHHLLKNETGCWAAFKNLKDEPEINWSDVSNNISWAFPRLFGEAMEFVKSSSAFAPSALGFSEPQNGDTIAVHQLNGFVIPAVAYDQYGNRLGRGKGFYDRALQGAKGLKIGLCFNVSLCEELPREAHDIKCDKIVTEKKIYNIK
jgi:5-formyltetrahydrofolate cyclo-ligase